MSSPDATYLSFPCLAELLLSCPNTQARGQLTTMREQVGSDSTVGVCLAFLKLHAGMLLHVNSCCCCPARAQDGAATVTRALGQDQNQCGARTSLTLLSERRLQGRSELSQVLSITLARRRAHSAKRPSNFLSLLKLNCQC